MLPCPLEELPDMISVVLLNAVQSDDEMRALARRARAVQVSDSAFRWVGCRVVVWVASAVMCV